MKHFLTSLFCIVFFTQAKAKVKFYASIHTTSMLMYTPTIGICPSIGISKNKNALYLTAGYSGRNMIVQYKRHQYSSYSELSYMKFGLGYNRYLSISKKSKLNLGAECLINYFDFSKSIYNDTVLTYNLNAYGINNRPLVSIQIGYNYFIKKHIAINVTSHVDFKQLSTFRRLPNSSSNVHSMFRPFFIPYVSVGVLYK
jgi:succinylglutamate desuccinylase